MVKYTWMMYSFIQGVSGNMNISIHLEMKKSVTSKLKNMMKTKYTTRPKYIDGNTIYKRYRV